MQNAEEGMSLTYEDFEVKLESRGIHLEEEERGRVFLFGYLRHDHFGVLGTN